MTDPRSSFTPFIPANSRLREFTIRSLVVGTLLGMIFGASSLYLVLKIGLTVSASIPVAVISISLFRLWGLMGGRDATILEHNIAQTAGSAGESLAFGVGVTMPAILILGFDLEMSRVFSVALLGGLLGILMMIPLRRALIVQQHGSLKYPEGTACAEVLKAGASQASKDESDPAYAKELANASVNARTIFAGFGIGLLYKVANVALKGWKDTVGATFGAPLKAGSLSAEISPEMLGVGYIIGPRIAGVMAAGGVLSYLVLIPLIKFFGEALTLPLPPESTRLIKDMSPGEIRSAYVLYIGAGAVAAGGLISLLRALPTIWRGIRMGLADFTNTRVQGAAASLRTERDLSLKFVAIGTIVLVTAITLAPALKMNLLGALLILLLGFLFTTVSSRLTGEIGSTSNPISGMTIATLLLTCGVFLLLGWTTPPYYVTALSVGAVVCIACSNGGTTSQDLKTGFLVGGTPKYQQIAICIGAAASALLMGPILLTLNEVGTVYVNASQVGGTLDAPASALTTAPREVLVGPQAKTDTNSYRVWHRHDLQGGTARKFLVDDSGKAVWLVDPAINGSYNKWPDGTTATKYDAPKATLVSYIIKGVLDKKLPWALVLLGVMIAVTMELCGVGSLAFAVGVYLPIATSLPIFIGGLVRWMVDRHDRFRWANSGKTVEEIIAEGDKSPGVLMASGYVAGGSIAGIIIAFMAGVTGQIDLKLTEWASAKNPFFEGANSDLLSLIPYAVLVLALWATARGKILADKKATT